jgi:hypothetical protein
MTQGALQTDGTESARQPHPPLYQRPAAVEPTRFAGTKVAGVNDFGFAAAADSLPLTVPEFVEACRTLPIVFADSTLPLPVVVTAIAGRSAVVNAAGQWSPDAYLPDYIRRYPFVLAAPSDTSDVFTLCIDEAFSGLNDKEGEPLFVGGHPSLFTKTVLDYCRAYQERHQWTKTFVAALEELDLLQPSQVALRLPDGSQHTIGGFKLVDRDRWNALDDSAILTLRAKGFLEPVICHLISQGNWLSIAARANTLANTDSENGRKI